MYIKKISGLRMMKNMRYFEPNHILVSVIKNKNIFAESQFAMKLAPSGIRFFILHQASGRA